MIDKLTDWNLSLLFKKENVISYRAKIIISCCLLECIMLVWTGMPKRALVELKQLHMRLNIPVTLDKLEKL